MAKHRIRITGSGIHGKPTVDNPTGEIPIGTEFETDADLPAGWAGRAVIVGEEPKQEAFFVVNEDDDSEAGKARNEVIRQAQKHFDEQEARHEQSTRAVVARAERAEADLQKANEQLSVLNEKLKAADRGDGDDDDGAHEDASADEIRSAVGMLDAKTDAHWTTTGLPAVEAVAHLTGKQVSRKSIEAAAPGFKRPA